MFWVNYPFNNYYSNEGGIKTKNWKLAPKLITFYCWAAQMCLKAKKVSMGDQSDHLYLRKFKRSVT